MDFFKVIGTKLGEFFIVLEPMMARRRMDVETILVSTPHASLPFFLNFKIHKVQVQLHVVENATEVEMADEDEGDCSQ